ncbi:translocation protein Sec62-domain-containing protein [Tuber borchii]|uniref:Translocation protein SEC62 n=1 Tax=Tuber borchii TaxID=42251 RepID=A0A2T6ZXE3_TUBBO|nr:translocation protein Sec62-domain-containing protein [Tuber borchii]
MAAPAAQSPPTASPEALAVAGFLRSQDLKCRTCILQGQRKELFKGNTTSPPPSYNPSSFRDNAAALTRLHSPQDYFLSGILSQGVKRALRALKSEAYTKAQKKNALLPPVTDDNSAVHVFSLLPRNLLALRVSKIDPAADDGHGHGHSHGKPAKRIKGLWTVKIEQQQEMREELYYTWFYEPRTWKQTIMAIGVIVVLLLVVMFPLWPPMLRLGVWYLSMGMLGLIGLFILMSIFRLILFLVTTVVLSPGIWLYPNLFEDVGFFDSFRPLWAWHKVKRSKKDGKRAAVEGRVTEMTNEKSAPPASTQSSAPTSTVMPPKPTVEDG